MEWRFGTLNRRLNAMVALGLVALLGVAVVPGAASAAAVKPTNWKLTAGAQSHDEGIQANAFLPHDVAVNVGDTITWTVATGEFHTVTFLSGANPPPFIALVRTACPTSIPWRAPRQEPCLESIRMLVAASSTRACSTRATSTRLASAKLVTLSTSVLSTAR